jgi:hypothetical protein
MEENNITYKLIFVKIVEWLVGSKAEVKGDILTVW